MEPENASVFQVRSFRDSRGAGMFKWTMLNFRGVGAGGCWCFIFFRGWWCIMRLPSFDFFFWRWGCAWKQSVCQNWRQPQMMKNPNVSNCWGEIPILDWELIQSSWQDIDIINACTDTVWLFLFEWWQLYLFDNYDIVMNQVSAMTIMFIMIITLLIMTMSICSMGLGYLPRHLS